MFDRLKLIPIYLLYLSTFGLASFEKLSSGGVPPWFEKQFGQTVLNSFPGAISISFYLVAVLEAITSLGFVISFCRREFLPENGKTVLLASLLLSEVVFTMLGFGLRITHDFTGAASLFFYFGITLVTIKYVEDSRG